MVVLKWLSLISIMTSALAAVRAFPFTTGGLHVITNLLAFPPQAVPRSKLVTRQSTCPNDAGNAGTFSQPCATYANAITCPFGIQGKAGGIVLLVHGTSGSRKQPPGGPRSGQPLTDLESNSSRHLGKWAIRPVAAKGWTRFRHLLGQSSERGPRRRAIYRRVHRVQHQGARWEEQDRQDWTRLAFAGRPQRSGE